MGRARDRMPYDCLERNRDRTDPARASGATGDDGRAHRGRKPGLWAIRDDVEGLIESHPLDDDQARPQLRDKNRWGFGPLMRRIRMVAPDGFEPQSCAPRRGGSSEVIWSPEGSGR